MVEFTKVDAWVLQVSDKFAEVTQFFNSEYYEGFAEWEESTWSLLEPYVEDVPRELILEEIYLPLKSSPMPMGYTHRYSSEIRHPRIRLGHLTKHVS